MSDESNSADVTILESTVVNNDTSSKPTAPSKKAVQNINQECVKKFTEGQPIIDKKNPFKNNNHSSKKYRTKEIYKNAFNSLQRSPSDELITTEDVLRQSKYVKTYIKNPDPYFVYDPEVLARIKADEKEQQRKVSNHNGTLSLTDKTKSVNATKNLSKSSLPYKKCSKPNYPNLADIKVKVGTELDGTFLNPTEVKTNAKKFDECVKKIKFNFDEYSEDEHLRNSSIEEISANIQNETHSNNRTKYNKDLLVESINCMDSPIGENCARNEINDNNEGSFSNTISSNEFKKYLKKKGLMLAPQHTSNGVKPSLPNRTISEPNKTPVPKSPENPKSLRQAASDRDIILMDPPKKVKKSSLFQRLLANNIFSVRRKTIPKETVPKTRSIYDSGSIFHINGKDGRQTSQNKRIVLERKNEQSESGEFNYISKPFRDGENMKPSDQTDCVQRNQPAVCDQSPIYSDNPLIKTENNCQSKHYSSCKLNKNRTQTMPPSLQHTKVYSDPTDASVQTFGRTSSMDRNEILKRSKAVGLQRAFKAPECFPSRSPTGSGFPSRPGTTSTPTRPPSSTDSGLIQCTSLSTLASSLYDDETQPTGTDISKNELNGLRAKQKIQHTKDCDLYTKVLNRKLNKNSENLYERLQRTQAEPSVLQPMYSAVYQSPQFVRGDPQRNTFCGVNRDPNYNFNNCAASEQTHSESNFQLSHKNTLDIQSQRLSGRNSLSREEIMEKVRQFCHNSMRRKPDHSESNTVHYVVQTSPEISPASYASVATERFFPKSRQDPQRIQSLPRKPLSALQPVSAGSSEVYANVWKHKNMSPNQTEEQRSGQSTKNEVVANKPQEFLCVESPANGGKQLKSCLNNSQVTSRDSSENLNVSKNNFAHTTKATGSPAAVYTLFQPRPNDGRSTPLILERSHNLQSQIYRPRQGGTTTHYNVRNHLLRQSNLRYGQYFSDSINFLPDKKTEIPKSVQQQQLLVTDAHEQYLPEVEENEGLKRLNNTKEDWQNENKSGRQQTNDQVNDERRRSSRREDPRRHTLGGDMLQYGVMPGQPQQRAMDLENQSVRSYAPVNQGPLFDEDPGIMSEVETASTGFRRGGKQRSSLPVVRTPSKTLERPLGLVFLQYRSETKRALLPNEITSIDTVRALFVRSFPRQLTMAYLEGPNVKIYIHDASKDMFYELEDVRSHLREIRDRSVLRLFESNEVAAPPQVLPGGPGIPQPLPQAVPMQWDQDQSYFSEPEFDSEYQHQHIHKSKSGKQPPYYVGASQTLPRGMYSDRNKVPMGAPAKPLRSYGSRGNMGPIFPYPPDQLYSIPDGYTSSPERGTRGSYEEPYYSQYGTRGNVAPVIDEETSEVAISDDQYALYGMKMGPGRIPRTANQMYDPTRPEDLHRIRVEHMERQLANLTGLVQKALVNQNPQIAPAAVPVMTSYLGVPTQCRANGTGEEVYVREKAPKLGKSSCHKSVSFEKSVSFSDDIQGVPKSHSPQHAADSKPTKPAIKSSTLPRTSSQERDRLKPPPPPKPIALTQTHTSYHADIALAPEVYNHLRGLQKKAKDLRMEVRTLRRLSQAQAVAVREDIKDAFMRIRATLLASSGNYWDQQGDQEKTRISREEELYKQEIIRLEKDLSDLESSVEGLRGEVINRRTRVNMAAVEDMALVLSRASKTVAELKLRFPGLSNGMRNLISSEMEKVVREEKFLKEEPDRLESALRRCKKLTGTLVTLKRLASVQEQRLPPNEPPTNEEPPSSAEVSTINKQPVPTPRMGPITVSGGVPPENALDALLDELQTFAKPLNQHNDLRPDDSTSDDSSQVILSTVTTQIPQACLYNPNDPNAAQHELQPEQSKAAVSAPLNPNSKVNKANMLHVNANLGSLRRLHSYPSGSDTDTSPPQPVRLPGKPPVPERNAELLSKVNSKRIPPPPPPRTSSRSPLASPTSPNVPHRMPSLNENEPLIGNGATVAAAQDGSGNSSGNESGNDQVQRQVALERRHQELLRKQKMLQEQYLRLQQMSKMPSVSAMPSPPSEILQLKKTGSESNLPKKMDLSIANSTGSMKNLNTEAISCTAGSVSEKNEKNIQLAKQQLINMPKAGVGVMSTPQTQTQTQTQKKEADGSSATCPETTLNNNSSSSSITTTIKQVYETEIL